MELWVNIDDGRRRVYQQMTEDIQNPERRFDGAEGRPGNFCLVCISDVWHRARIVSVESGIYNVFLIDRGQPHATTGGSLAWGRSDSFVLPPETESCILADVVITERELGRAEDFLKSLPGKRFEALVQDLLTRDRIIVLNVPAVFQEMREAGLTKPIPAEEFGNLVRRRQDGDLNGGRQFQTHGRYLYPALLADAFEYVHVAEAIDPHNVFCRLLIFSGALRILAEELQQHYEEIQDSGGAQPRASGDPCAAKGADGRWNRSVLKQDAPAAADGADGAVEVMHVDEGTTELVPVDHIKPLHEKFLRMPVVTYRCRLHGVKESAAGWNKNQTDYLRSLILHQTVLATFSCHETSGDAYQVVLYANDAACLNSCFLENASPGTDPKAPDGPVPPLFPHSNTRVGLKVQETFSSTKTPTTDGGKEAVVSNGVDERRVCNGSDGPVLLNRQPAVFPSEETATSDGTLAVGRNVAVKVTCVESPRRFWCQTTEKSSSLRRLMENLQSHYAFAHPQPIAESICVARNPDDGMWYRARIVASPHSPVVDVRYIDYGHVRKVPLRDVRPIDPAFLRLSAQAFQCCLSSAGGGSDPAALSCGGSTLAAFQKSEDRCTSPDMELRCVVKAVTLDEDGLPLNVVGVEAPSDGGGRLVARQRAQEEEDPLRTAPGDAYNRSTYSLEVGGEETVSVTSCNDVSHFYCNLEKNAQLLSDINDIIQRLVAQGECRQRVLGADGVCIAKHPDARWYRGRVVENSQQIRVHFVDYGDTLVVSEADVCAFPEEVPFAKAVPVQAILLGLFDVPEDVPQEVNLWFADRAIGRTFTMSVVAKAECGKLIVDLFDGAVKVNAAVREMMGQVGPRTTATPEQQQPDSQSDQSYLPQEARDTCSDAGCVRDQRHSEISDFFTQEDQKTFEAEDKEILDVTLGGVRTHLEPEVKQPLPQTCSEGNVNICTYMRPDVSTEQMLEVFASCIVGPRYFWCQYANTEELDTISRLAQEVGQFQTDLSFSVSLDPGSPCLALFADDEQWYRAQVMRRHDNELHVVFIDYGNEADVEVTNVKSLPQALLERPPQAFLCSLDGFEESQGTWDDTVCDVFYNLLVDEPLRVTVFKILNNQATALLQHSVQIECEKTNVNKAVKEYWTPIVKNTATEEEPISENVLQRSQNVSTGIGSIHTDKNQNNCKTKMEAIGSCIVGPFFFWCQYANTEDLGEISRLCQEAGRSQLDTKFSKSLVPGSLCLALFSRDNQWYRAQVKGRQDDSFHVVFIDYGNEVDVKNVRALPQALLDVAPQAFLCSLSGFEESRGSWDDRVYDDFYNLLVNKPLKLSVLKIEKHLEMALPQNLVEIECEGEDITEALKKHWKPLSKQSIPEESPNKDAFTQDGEARSSQTHCGDPEDKANAVVYKQPTFSRSKHENVYASCIVGPCYFWCQYADTENLVEISRLCQEAGRTQPDEGDEAAVPGGPCLALFSGDSQWYRAQVMDRRDATVRVVFVDYGNEDDVDAKHVRPLPPCLLGTAPQAFLCCLNGFDGFKDSWRDDVCEDFHSLLVDRPLRVTVINTKTHPDIEVPQYTVQVEFKDVLIGEWQDVNTLMEERARQKAKLQLG